MKRAPALRPLSREHHHALEVALKLRRAGADDLDAVTTAFAAFWRRQGQAHFDVEESVLDGLLETAMYEQMFAEHQTLRLLATSFLAQPDVEGAQRLGRTLHEHVRFEERGVFPALEQRLSAEALERVGVALHEGHR